MKTLLLPIFFFAAVGRVWAQADSPDCYKCYTVEDAACDPQESCANWANSVSRIFIAPCTGTYKFACKTVCADPGNCHVCASCSRLIDVSTGQLVEDCETVFESGGGCERGCEYTYAVTLIASRQYQLEVSLQKCWDIDHCMHCYCTAQARVYHPGSDCAAW